MSELNEALRGIVEESSEDTEAIENELKGFFGVPVTVTGINSRLDNNRVTIEVQPEDFSESLQDEIPDADVEGVRGNVYLDFGVDFDS